MFTVTCYTFYKNRDSTATPADGTGTNYQCNIKSPSSIVNPRIDFRFGDDFAPSGINYMHIEQYRRYYYVREWTFDRGIWTADLACDVLASFKLAIGTQTEYVLRASADYNGAICDTTYPVTGDYQLDYYVVSRNFATNLDGGDYVVGIINNSTVAVGAVSYYVFTQSQFSAFKAALMDSAQWTGVLDISDDLLKTIFNPFQYIVSCKWFPTGASRGDSVSSFRFGWWDFSTSCYLLNPNQQSVTRTPFTYYNPPSHPQAATRGKYLNLSPYTERSLAIAPYGLIEIPTWAMQPDSTIWCEETIDYISGVGTLLVQTTNAAEKEITVAQVSSQFGIDIQLAQISADYLPVIRSGFEAAGKLLSLDFGGAIAEATSGIGTLATTSPLVQTSGGNDGFSSLNLFNNRIWLYSKYNLIADESLQRLGRPLCEERQLSTLAPGFIRCLNAQVSMAATAEEIDEVERYLNDGFYLTL